MIKKNYLDNNYVKILKYMTYQGIKINNNLLKEINSVDINKNGSKNIRINKLLFIFKDICEKYDIDYLYYIFIFEHLTNDYIRNIFRLFNYKYIRLNNEDEKFNKLKLKFVKLKYTLNDFNLSSNPKELLIDLLNSLKEIDENIILYFISCINLFFT